MIEVIIKYPVGQKYFKYQTDTHAIDIFEENYFNYNKKKLFKNALSVTFIYYEHASNTHLPHVKLKNIYKKNKHLSNLDKSKSYFFKIKPESP